LLKNWSWYDTAVAADLKDVQVRAIEEGRRDPEFTTLVRLARVFNLSSLDQLLVPSSLEKRDPQDP
jgi:DNA-binding XRE family transcriptional regulator